MSHAKTPDTAGAIAQKWVGTWAEVEQAQLETMLRATPAPARGVFMGSTVSRGERAATLGLL